VQEELTPEEVRAEVINLARSEHGKLIRVDVYGREYIFRPMGLDEAQAVATKLDRAPEVALSTALDAVRACCVTDIAEFDEAADNFPLAFSAERGVCSRLLALASSELADQVKEAIGRWRHSGRQLGSVAEDLLAFQAYKGGIAEPKALAGALHWAEHFDTSKAQYQLHLSFMRAMGKRH
jgi:hypothetical protein